MFPQVFCFVFLSPLLNVSFALQLKKLFYIHVLSEPPENFEGGQGSLASFLQIWKLGFRKVIGLEVDIRYSYLYLVLETLALGF